MQKALRGISGADALTMEDEWGEWHDSYDGGSVGGSVSYGDIDDEAYCADDWDVYDDWGYGGDDYDECTTTMTTCPRGSRRPQMRARRPT